MEIKNLNEPFIITPNKLLNLTSLNHIISLSDCYLYSLSPDYIFQKQENNHSIYIIGYAIDIRDGMLSKENIAVNLINEYIKDTDSFISSLDYISGRYVLFIDNGINTSIYTDATGLKPIFYWNNVFGSHEILVRNVVNINYSAEISEPNRRLNGYLDYSNSNEILKVNPNFSYNMSNEIPIRIYPRQNYKIKNSQDIIDLIIPTFEEQIKWLGNQNKKLYLSLTGGFDSKVTMALTKKLQDKISYFTYMRNTDNSNRTTKWIYSTDKKIVDKLIYNLNLNHQYIYIDDFDWPKEDISKLSKHTTSNHSFKLGLAMRKELEENSFHIKSTLYELGKVPFELELENISDLESLHEVASKWKPQNMTIEESQDYYKEFLQRNDYDTVLKFNYHLPFILYWETRMGNWHSNITQETDLHQDTFVIINNRFTLDKFISLTLPVRESSSLFKELIKRNWPILNYFIPNSNLTLEDELKDINAKRNNSLNKNNLIIKSLKNINLSISDNIYDLYPLANTLLKDDQHILEIQNQSKYAKSFTITGYYSKAPNLIKIKINNKIYDITHLINPIKIILNKNESVEIEYIYSNNFDKQSWIDAGYLTLKFS